MTTDIREDQVWEDKEGFRWKVLTTGDNDVVCSCVSKPSRRRTVGKFKVGQRVTWASDEVGSEASTIFHKLIQESDGTLVAGTELEVKDLELGDLDSDPNFNAQPLETYNAKGKGEGEEDGEGEGKGKGVPQVGLPEDQEQGPEDEDYLLALELRNKKYKINFEAVTDKHIKKFNKVEDTAKVVPTYGKKIELKGKLTQKSVQSIIDAIKKSSSHERRDNNDNIQVVKGQLWKNKADNCIFKIIHVETNSNGVEMAYYLRIKNHVGEAPKFYNPSHDNTDSFKKYYDLTDVTQAPTSEELGCFPQLKFIKARMDKEQPTKVMDEETEEVKQLNMQFNDSYYAMLDLTEIVNKLNPKE